MHNGFDPADLCLLDFKQLRDLPRPGLSGSRDYIAPVRALYLRVFLRMVEEHKAENDAALRSTAT